MSGCFLDKFNNKPRKIIKAVIHLSQGISIAKIFLIDSLREYLIHSLTFLFCPEWILCIDPFRGNTVHGPINFKLEIESIICF